jgi:PAS domain S-box-containing protein
LKDQKANGSMAQFLTGNRIFMTDADLIVSKTDKNGRITYANETFMRISGFTLNELMGAPHSIIRHPSMPRSLFKHIWQNIEKGNETFAYLANKTKNGDYYWVLAHITPTFSNNNEIVGYHSNRRNVSDDVIRVISPLYESMLNAENKHPHKEEGMKFSSEILFNSLHGKSYDEFVLSL